MALLGPPGSGKGTQGAVVCENLGIAHIASGDLLRDAVQRGTELGRQAKEFMEAGQLVPDDLVLGLMRERLAVADCASGWLLDGFPRTIAQAEALGEMLEGGAGALEHVVALDVAREEVVIRLGGRRTCSGCNRLYHVRFSPPAAEGVCDACGAELTVRPDDREETILERLDVYERQTAPLLDYYRDAGLLDEVDGNGKPDQVSARVMNALEIAA